MFGRGEDTGCWSLLCKPEEHPNEPLSGQYENERVADSSASGCGSRHGSNADVDPHVGRDKPTLVTFLGII